MNIWGFAPPKVLCFAPAALAMAYLGLRPS
jgi:hypothetical protein